MLQQSTIIIITISTLAMLSPGPDFFMVVKNALRYQRKAAMATAWGITAGIATHMIYCIAGIALLIKETPWLFSMLKYVGAAYLAWIGIKAILAKVDSKVSFSSNNKEVVTIKSAFLQGYFCNLLNPKATLFFLAFFTQMLAPDSLFIEKLSIAVINIALGMIWWPLLVLIVQHQAVQRKLSRIQIILDKLLGLVLLGLSIRVAFFS